MRDRGIAEGCIFMFQFACEDFPDTRAVKEVHIYASYRVLHLILFACISTYLSVGSKPHSQKKTPPVYAQVLPLNKT